MTTPEQDWVWHVRYVQDDPECLHIFPKDWHFGGPTGEDPRADPRWLPNTYLFIDRTLTGRYTTSEPFCDHDARGPYRLRVNDRLSVKLPEEPDSNLPPEDIPLNFKGKATF